MQQQIPPNMLQPVEELTPKRQAVVDRLRRRLDAYRRRQIETLPRCDQSFSVACEQQNMETSTLQKRFFEGKTKRVAKKGLADRKPDLPVHTINNLHSSVHVQQKFGCGDYDPPKLQCGSGGGGGGGGGGRGEALTKFSVEIVQQLEFTTSAADSHPQQISTNVTVKALTNAAVKSDSSPPPPAPPPPPPAARAPSPLECKRECKSELPDDDFVGLDECAAALERDAFPGLADLIGEEDGDDITSAAIEDLITEISEYPEFMKNFDLDGGARGADESGRLSYNGGPELSPAAQTLKQMAEQHQQAAAAEWGARYRPYPPYRPRAPQHDLHISQAQQLHISQQHHNLQVSGGQHMQVSGGGGGGGRGHVSVAAQQAMYANFAHSPQGGAAPLSPHDSYTVSQSQTINFSQLRQRQPQAQSQHHGTPLGSVVAAGLSHELRANLMQQKQNQLLRQQQLRPPPPEYKPPGGPGAGGVPLYAGGRRVAGPPYQQHPRPSPAGYAPDWRHVAMQGGIRHPFSHHQGSFNMGGMGGGGGPGMTMQQQQNMHQQLRLQQQQHLMQQHQQQQRQNQQGPMSHIIMQQNQGLSAHGQMSNIHMSQSQSISMQQGGSGMPGTDNGNGGGSAGHSTAHFPSGGFPSAPADFSLDFLDSIPSADGSNLTAQELLSSLDNSLFNDIM